jgi:hypothetical protein
MSWLRKSLCALAVCAATGMSATACETNEGIVFVVGVLDAERTDCVAQPESDAILLHGGVIDLAVGGARPYKSWLLVASQLTPRGSREQIRIEPNYINLEGAEVSLQDATGGTLDIATNPFSTFGSGVIPPSEGSEPGLGVMLIDLLPAGVAQQLGTGTLIARVRAFGTTLGGTAVESNGCLITYPQDAFDPTQGDTRFVCAESGAEDDEGGCFIGQDDLVPCTVCATVSNACKDPCQNCAFRPSLDQAGRCMGEPAPTCPAPTPQP